jgi:hypothetical protein
MKQRTAYTHQDICGSKCTFLSLGTVTCHAVVVCLLRGHVIIGLITWGYNIMQICFYTCKKISVEWGNYMIRYIKVNDV